MTSDDSKEGYKKILSHIKRVVIGIIPILAITGAHSRERDIGEHVPGIGWVPTDLCYRGIKDLEPNLASTINSLYLLSRNYDEGRLVSRSDVPIDIAAKVEWDNAMVAIDTDEGRNIYDKHNIWRTPAESKALFAKKIKEALSGITDKQYGLLNNELRAVVDHAKDIVAKESLELKIVHYQSNRRSKGPYNLP